LQAANGGKVVTKRVEWMYNGTTDGDGALGDDREAYLLGKRRIDNLLKSNDTQSLQKGAAVGIDAVGDPNANANTARDTQQKVLQDPLLMIQKQKMEMQLKAMKAAQKDAQYKEKRDKEKERKHSHKHRERERSRDREHKHRSRHDRDRSRSPRRREDREHRHHRDSHRRRSKSRSRSPYRKHSSRAERSPSPRRRENRDRGDLRDRDNYRRRDRTPLRRQSGDTKKEDNKADRLAQMQAEAASLEKERAERVREQEIKDAEEEEKHKKSMDGGRRFISSVRGQASNMDLGDVIARGRQNYRAEVDG
jgi:hypothetical protein